MSRKSTVNAHPVQAGGCAGSDGGRWAQGDQWQPIRGAERARQTYTASVCQYARLQMLFGRAEGYWSRAVRACVPTPRRMHMEARACMAGRLHAYRDGMHAVRWSGRRAAHGRSTCTGGNPSLVCGQYCALHAVWMHICRSIMRMAVWGIHNLSQTV